MKSELITKLNIQISLINPETIRQHEATGDMDDWIAEWRTETAAVSYGLYALMYEVLKRAKWEGKDETKMKKTKRTKNDEVKNDR